MKQTQRTLGKGNNKRGVAVFFGTDMFWFLIFILITLLFYFLLFRPLTSNTENKIDVRRTSIDADYVAQSLLRWEIHTDITSEPYEGESFATLVQGYMKKYVPDTITTIAGVAQTNTARLDFENSPEYILYTQTIEKAFAGMKQDIRQNGAARTDIVRIIGYTVVLRNGDSFIAETCVPIFFTDQTTAGIPRPDAADYCSFESRTNGTTLNYQDPTTGLRMPFATGIEATQQRFPVQAGTAFIPSDNGPITLHVFLITEVLP